MSESELLDDIVLRIRSVLPDTRRSYALHEPHIGLKERSAVDDCLRSGFVSSAGGTVERFEEKLASCAGSRFAVAVVNGTAALHLALLLADVRPDDEVIVPALSFIASANSAAYCGAAPHFAECSSSSLSLDPKALEEHLRRATENIDGRCRNRQTGRTIKAVMLVHPLGHPGQLEPLEQLCLTFGLRLVVDGAAALGTRYYGKPLGATDHPTAVSFNGNKIATTGGGGALLTNDLEVARVARHLATTAKLPHAWRFDHDRIGYNYRLPAINAALGLAQLERLPQLLSRKRQLANAYAEAFRDCKAVRMLAEPPGATSNFWLNAVVLDESLYTHRDALLERLHGEGMLARPLWTPLPQQRMYRGYPGMPTPVADNLAQRVVCLPSSAILGGPLDE